jgi:hypothetical protein
MTEIYEQLGHEAVHASLVLTNRFGGTLRQQGAASRAGVVSREFTLLYPLLTRHHSLLAPSSLFTSRPPPFSQTIFTLPTLHIVSYLQQDV